MKTALIVFLLLVMGLGPAGAHVGSPDVFFQGKAGSIPVRVSIRPPATLPGVARVTVQTDASDVARITVRPVFSPVGVSAAPEAIEAVPVPSGAGLRQAELWLLRPGPYKVEVDVASSGGSGTAVIPFLAAATRVPQMSARLATLVGALVLALGAGLIRIAWLAGRSAASQYAARRAAISVGVLVFAGLAALGWRWQTIDRDFRERALDRPVPVQVITSVEKSLTLLKLTPSAAESWNNVVPDHGKLMHLFLVREPEATAFAHLHPVRRDAATFENVLPPLPAGAYALYGEITRETSLSQTLLAHLTLPAPSGPALLPQADARLVNEVWCRPAALLRENSAQPVELDADDSWTLAPAVSATSALLSPIVKLADGARLILHQPPEGFRENQETTLRFQILDRDGRTAVLQPYMGMAGHAIVRRADGSVFTHLHPAGTISMAAQALLAGEAPAPPMEPMTPRSELTFPYAFPRSGEYRVWVQVRVAGRIQTGVFDIVVAAAK